jgi:Coenzyme PQQ synthesis protein D (PqqD)
MAFAAFKQRLIRNGNLIPTLLEGDIVLFSVRAGTYFGLNGTGTCIWNMLAEPRNIGQVLDSLERLYAVSRDDLERDVEPFLRALIKQDVIRIVHEDAGR